MTLLLKISDVGRSRDHGQRKTRSRDQPLSADFGLQAALLPFATRAASGVHPGDDRRGGHSSGSVEKGPPWVVTQGREFIRVSADAFAK